MSYDRLLKTNEDYEKALSRIDKLFDSKSGTPEANELELLVALVELYEKEHSHIEASDPIEAIRAYQLGYGRVFWQQIEGI